MKGRIEIKSAAIGAVLVGLVVLAAGATGGPDAPLVIGRFQIACTNTSGFLFDTATGQVWNSSGRRFYEPKLQVPPAVTAETTAFLGRWIAEDPAGDNVIIRVEPNGRLVATDDDERHEGSWRIEGTRIIMTADDETVVGQLQPDGRLILWEADDEEDRIAFKRAD